MHYLILAFAILALWHWWYEAVLAPTERLGLRFKLFVVRDDLRALKIQLGDAFEDRHYHYLQDSINNAIAFLPRLDIALLMTMMWRLQVDDAFRERVEARSKILDDCRHEETKVLRKRTTDLVQSILAANSGGWALYLVPIVLTMVFYKWTRKITRSLMALSKTDLEIVAHNSSMAAAPT